MPQISRIWRIAGQVPLQPEPIAEVAEQNGWPMGWAGLANGISCPRGRRHGEAHFIVSNEVKAALTLTAPLDITCTHEDGTQTWLGYYAIRTEAIAKDKARPPHWITLADRRWILERAAVNKRYNLRRSKTDYVPSSLNAGDPWTWAEILEDLWGMLPSAAGAFPALDVTPASLPENLVLDGKNVWRTINQILTSLGVVSILNPFAGTFSFAFATDTQPGLADLKTSNADRLLWQFVPQALPQANYPEKVVVTFHKIPGDNPDSDPFPAEPEVEEASLGESGIAGTEYPIVDLMFAYDDNSSERMVRTNELKEALKGLLKPMARPWGAVYSGIVDFVPGAELTDVSWTSEGSRGMETIARFVSVELDWLELVIGEATGGSFIEYTIDSMTTSSEPDYIGLKKATVTVRGGPGALVGETVSVYDHSGCIFDEAEMVGYTGWAFWGPFRTLDETKDCDVLTPSHWAACNRCCAPDSGTYRECE